MRSRQPSTSPLAAPGYTLLEAMVSLVIVTVLLGAVTSTMLLASRAVGGQAGGVGAIPEGRDAAEQIACELSLALGFSERSETAVEFTVPDRNGDGQVETIRYEWSGLPGGSLTRRYNHGSEAVLVENVHSFSLSYLLKTVVPGASQEPQESDEVILIYHDDASGGSMADYSVQQNKWCGQYFCPSLPTNTISWKVTGVRVRPRSAGSANGQMAVQIRTATAEGKPTGEVLAAQVLEESSLSEDYQWVELPLGPLPYLEPGQGLCLVVRHQAGNGTAGQIEYEKNNHPMTPNAHWLTSSSGGNSWTTFAQNRDMRFYVLGTYTTQGTPQWP